MVNVDFFLNALIAGILLGGFYAAISVGLSLSFGLLDVVNIAHPAFIISGSYLAFYVNSKFGVDPILAGLLFAVPFYFVGVIVYRIYYNVFEKTGAESLRGLVFFFGLFFLIEVLLIITFGVDYRLVQADYIGKSVQLGPIGIAYRLFVPFLCGGLVSVALYIFLKKTFFGRAVMGVAQDALAVRLMGINPIRVKTVAFGLSIATATMAGALLIMIGPVEPTIGREYIGRVFAVTVLGGLGSMSGTLLAALVLGVAESFTSSFFGPSWSLAVSFGILLVCLAVRPSGLFGR
ncbi:MAG: branched-chain amino acid ABC transporter permease [bacterium]|nr:branched-chain amino acid ABC transporter permease [bacterium]